MPSWRKLKRSKFARIKFRSSALPLHAPGLYFVFPSFTVTLRIYGLYFFIAVPAFLCTVVLAKFQELHTRCSRETNIFTEE